MNSGFLKKGLIILIIILFVGTSILPRISGKIKVKKTEVFNFSPLDPNLVGYWNFNDGTATDNSGNQRDGIIYGAIYHDSGGPDNSGYFEFNGDAYIDIPNTDGLAFNNQDFSFACWAQIYDNADYYRYFISLGDPEYFNYNFVIIGKLRSGATDGRLVVCLHDHETNQFGVYSNLEGNELPKYKWFHLVGVYDYSDNQLKMYYNSVLQDDITYFGNYDLSCSPLELNIGRLICPYAHSYHVGKLDEIRIYDKALSQSEIDDLYNIIENNPPVADFTWSPTDPMPDETVTFDASDSYDPDGTIVLYQWDWDNDGYYDESYTNPTAEHLWSDPGNYQVGLRVIDNRNATSIKIKTINIANQPPVADFTWTPSDPKLGEIITFDASESSDVDGYIVFYEWDWDNDGNYDEIHTEETATYSWSSLGKYPVTLRVTDNYNATDIITKIVNIINIIVPDDYETIQQAIAHSESGYNIIVKSGVYDSFVVDVDLLTIKGENKGNTIIDGNGTNHCIKIPHNADNNIISGFTIRNSGSNNAGIYIESSYNNIKNNIIIQNGASLRIFRSNVNQLHNNSIEDNLWGVHIDKHSHSNIIKNNEIKGNTYDGIIIDQLSTGNIIQNNFIMENYDSGLRIEGVSKGNLIINNNFERNRFGVHCVDGSDGNLFHHNTFIDNVEENAWDSSMDRWDNDVEGNYWSDYTGTDNDGDGIGDTPYIIPPGINIDRYPLMEPPVSNTFLSPRLKVNYKHLSSKQDDNCNRQKTSSISDIIVPDDYPSIQEAINNCIDGDTIIVKENTYYENIIVDKSLKIKVFNNHNVIVDGSGGSHVFFVIADSVEISGFTIQNTSLASAGVRIMGNFSEVYDNMILDCGSGVEIYGRYNRIHNNTIHNNSISNNTWGLYIKNCKDCKVENNKDIIENVNGIEVIFSSLEISYNNIKNSEEQGIIVQQNCNNVVVKGNNLIDNCDSDISNAAAIQIYKSDYCVIVNNDILNNLKDGIIVCMSSNNTFVDNVINDNYKCPLAIWLNSHNNSIVNNVIQTSYVYGIFITYSNDNRVYKNNIININNQDCITFRSSSNNKIKENNFLHTSLRNNNKYGFRLYSSSYNNVCYHNNFFYGCDAIDECSNNWDDTYFCGSYWENYLGSDADGDGIGDVHYDIFGGSWDNYPLMYPWDPPGKSITPHGETNGIVGNEYTYFASASDPNDYLVCYGWDWDGDLVVDDWTGYFDSGKVVSLSHKWDKKGTFQVSVIVKNERGQVSEWSDSLKVSMPRTKIFTNNAFMVLFHRFTNLLPILKILLHTMKSG